VGEELEAWRLATSNLSLFKGKGFYFCNLCTGFEKNFRMINNLLKELCFDPYKKKR
jgi:hypothetical protein